MVKPEAITAFASYAWPGNVRQLRHVVERLVVTLADGVPITAADVYSALPAAPLGGATLDIPIFADIDSLDAYLDQTLLNLYEHFVARTGSHSKAAKLLNVDRVALHQRIKRVRRRVMQRANSV